MQISKSVGHDENNCRAYELMMESGADTYRMKEEEHGQEENGQHDHRGGYQERVQGGVVGQGHGHIIFYNCGQLGRFARDC